jgi:hypothetical protein
MIKKINYKNKLYALIINKKYKKKKGINFFTPNNFTQQIGYMNHKKGHVIQPHIHKERLTKIIMTTETLIILEGLIRIDFYNTKQKYLFSKKIKGGDIIFLMYGGHGFEILKDTKMIEVKQGPFKKDKDKEKFLPINEKKLRYK